MHKKLISLLLTLSLMFSFSISPVLAIDDVEVDVEISNLNITFENGRSVKYYFDVTNNGTEPVANLSVSGVVSADETYDYSRRIDRNLGNRTFFRNGQTLEPGETHTVSIGYYIRSTDPEKYPYIIVKIDSRDELDEFDENNNIAIGDMPKIDLVIDNLEQTLQENNFLRYSVEVTNNGNITLTNVMIAGVASADETYNLWSRIDKNLGRKKIKAIEPGETMKINLGYNVSGYATHFVDRPYIVVKVDALKGNSNGRYMETSEENNVLSETGAWVD